MPCILEKENEDEIMSQALAIQRLTSRLEWIEAEIGTVREELAALPKEEDNQSSMTMVVVPTIKWVNKTLLKQKVGEWFNKLSIDCEPISAEALQELMRKENLGPNELSRSIIAAREE